MEFFKQGRDRHFCLGIRYPARTDELHDSKGFQFVVHLFDFMPSPCFGKNKEISANRHYLAVALFDYVLYLPFVEQKVRGNLEQGRFLVNRLLIRMIEGLYDLDLFFGLSHYVTRPVRCCINDYSKFRYFF